MMIGRKDKTQIIRIWNKMQDHLDMQSTKKLIMKDKWVSDCTNEQLVLIAMTRAAFPGEELIEKVLKLQQEYAL